MKQNIVITITREFGAEGHEIGMVLAKKLGIKLYDKELLCKAALRNGTVPELVGHMDETVEQRFMKPYLGLGMSAQEDNLFEQEAQVIRDLAAKESCIIVGRLADYILRHEPNTVKVYIYAPEEDRIEIIRKKHRITTKESKKLVRKMDTARKNYYSFYSLGKWSQKKGKDLTLNRSAFGVEGCASIIEAAVKCKQEELNND